MELRIDEEFKNLLPELTEEEKKTLEQSILKYGVQTPLLLWKGCIIDGHNRYMICKLNGIENVPVREMDFPDRESVIEWILQNQLGRRNLSDFQRARVALRYESMIARKARERQAQAGGDRKSAEYKIACVQMNRSDNQDTHRTRDEIAKIANTSASAVMRTKYILDHGSEEQIARAEKGGSGNSVSAIVREIKNQESKPRESLVQNMETRVCCDCGEEKPLTEFNTNGYGGYRPYCKACRGQHVMSEKAKQVINDLHNCEKEVEYTALDLEEEVRENVKPSIETIRFTLEQRSELMQDADCRKRIREVLNDVVFEIKKIIKEKCL